MVSKNEYANKLRMLLRRGGRVWTVDKRSRLYSQAGFGHCNSDRKNAEARHCFPFWICLGSGSTEVLMFDPEELVGWIWTE